MAVFDNAGQDCCARSRIFVEARSTIAWWSSSPTRPQSSSSATRRMRRPRSAAWSARAARAGAEYIGIGTRGGRASWCMGGEAARPATLFDIGAYLMPTIFDGAGPDMRIVREEIFGPVVAIIPFAIEAEAVGWPTTRRTGCRARSGAATSAGRSGWPRAFARACSRSTSNDIDPHRGAVRRLQDVRHGARARHARA